MTNTISISCILDTTSPASAMGFEVWVDETKFIDIKHVEDRQEVRFDISDKDGEHELKFVLKNKTEAHTQIDEAGNIVNDAVLTISDLAFDEIQLGYMLTELAVYSHDFNGTKETTQEKFYGSMGCNGTVSLKFTTPIYLWMLENM